MHNAHIPASIQSKQLGVGRGAIIMGNVFLSTSLLYLASEEAGCIDEEDNLITDCENTVYGFAPASLITNVAVISGLLTAFFMPVVGAIIDYTPHRRLVGIITSVLVTLIQAIQIGTVSSTWFPMAILQAIVGSILIVQILATFAYLPEIAQQVSETAMNHFTSWSVFLGFSSQVVFLILVIAVSSIAGLDDVQTGHVGQVLCTIWLVIFFTRGWKLLPSRPATRKLPEGHSLLWEGFQQNWRSVKKIHRHYKAFQWFLLATALAEAGVTSLLPIAVTFLQGELNLSGTQVGIVFLIALISALPGTYVGAKITERLDPNTSWKLSLLAFGVVTTGGSFALTDDRTYLAFVWGFLWGVCLGWFYACEALFFSLCVPVGHEAEFSGLFIYSNQILVWVPPLLFSVLVETGVEQRFGLLSLVTFQVLAIAVLMLVAPWEEVLQEAKKELEVSPGAKQESNSALDLEEETKESTVVAVEDAPLDLTVTKEPTVAEEDIPAKGEILA
jgi:UMF1 family MFS transporter